MNWKTPITLGILVVILVGAAFYGWQAVRAPTTNVGADGGPGKTPGTTAATPPCKKVTQVRKGDRIDAGDVLVNVYNASSVPGLASGTLTALAAKGFQSGLADDAPTGTTATNVTILAKNNQDPAVQLVAQQFTGTVTFSTDDLGSGVDVVLGEQFESVDPQAKTFFVEKETVTKCKSKKPTP